MGASEFFTVARGKTAKEAFSSAISEARYHSGHDGYTGTIAEKDTFVVFDFKEEVAKIEGPGLKPIDIAEELLNNDDSRISDKWGPAGCFKLENDKWLFFGWASS